MHGPSASDEDESIAAINIIPLVDVVLVLLIIFMVTTVFSRDSAMKLDLPQGSRTDQPQQPPAEITVTVDPKSQIYVNGQLTELAGLNNKIQGFVDKDKARKSILVLRGDSHVLYGKIMPVLDEISRSGVQLTLALQPATANPK